MAVGAWAGLQPIYNFSIEVFFGLKKFQTTLENAPNS